MNNANAQPQQLTQPISGMIARVGAKGKFFDIRDNLVAAKTQDYAMIHGIGGAKFAPRSGLRFLITDYSTPVHQVVACNVSPEMVEYFRLICEQNAGAVVTTYAAGINYTYKQDRVNSWKIGADGFCPVSQLQVVRAGMRGTEVSRMPWTIKITQCEARAVSQPNGTVSFNPQSARNTKEAFITMTDLDFFRVIHRACRFVELWEMTYGIPLLRQGEAMRTAELNTAEGSN